VGKRISQPQLILVNTSWWIIWERRHRRFTESFEAKKKPRHLRGFFYFPAKLLLFLRCGLFLRSLLLCCHFWIHLQFSFLYDYCSPLTGKLSVRNIFKLCHI